MKYPPRLSHLATRSVLIARLLPSYAKAHEIDDEEAASRLTAALTPGLTDRILAATWLGLLAGTKRLDEAALLEKVAGSLADRPQSPGRLAKPTPAWNAFLLLLDLEAGTASDMARRVLEGPDGQKRIEDGLTEAGKFLAAELTR